MMIDLIAPRNVYLYRRKTSKALQEGRIQIGERIKKANGWWLLGHDRRNNLYLELRPGHIISPVRRPAAKDMAPTASNRKTA
jgi:hypothetical protein